MIFYNLMINLNNLGHDVKVFNAVAYGTKIDKRYKNIINDVVIHKECFNRYDRFAYFLKQKKIYRSLISSCEVNNYDLIHSHTLFNGGYVAYLIKKHFKIPYIVSIRSTDINIFLRIPLFSYLANKIVKDASGVIFLSKPYLEEFIKRYVKSDLKKNIKNKSIIIYNGVEKFWLRNKSNAKRLKNNNKIKILSVGKISKRKNINTTIKAIELLISKGYEVNLTVVGKVIDKNILKKIQKFSYVEVKDFIGKEELIDLYRENDIFITPSIHETFGLVYVEALTQGLPIIYSKGQGFDGAFKDGSVGFAVPPKDVSYIAKSILKIINDYSNISNRCVEFSEKFDWFRISNKLSYFYYKSKKD